MTLEIGPMYRRFAHHHERILHAGEFNAFSKMLDRHIATDQCEACRAERQRWNRWADGGGWPTGWEEFGVGCGLVMWPTLLWEWLRRK